MKSIVQTMIVPTAIALAFSLLTSCTLTVDPDGTRNWSVSGAEIARGIIIYSK